MQLLKPYCYQKCFFILRNEQIDYKSNKRDLYTLQRFQY